MKKLMLTICLGIFLIEGCNESCWIYSGKHDERLKLYVGKRADVSQEKNWTRFQSDCRRCEISTMRSSHRPFGCLMYMGSGRYDWANVQYCFENCMENNGYRQITVDSSTSTLKWKHDKRWHAFHPYETFLNQSKDSGF